MKDSRAAVREALADARVIDPHCHLQPDRPAARTLADLVLYHHVWIELVSSGMPQDEVTRAGLPHELADPEMGPLERVRRALRYLPNVKSTTSGLLLRWLLADLYGIEELGEDNLAEAAARVAERASDPRWADTVLRERCGIQGSLSVEGEAPSPAHRIAQGREVYLPNIVDGKRQPWQVLEAWEQACGREIRNAKDYRACVSEAVATIAREGRKFVGLWPLPYLAPEPPEEGEATRILERARRREPLSQAEAGAFCSYGVTALLEELRVSGPRTVQLIVGAEVLPPHRAITHWDPRFPGTVGRLAARFPEVHFNLSTASDLYTQDIGILAKHIPNISVAGYWWHVFYPRYLAKSIETRLDMVPLNKIVGFFSDAYHAEWCWPKLKLVKQVLEEVLAGRVERGWYTLETALEIIPRILHENPKAIYGL